MKLRNRYDDVEIIMSQEEARCLLAELYGEEWSFPTMGNLRDESKSTTKLIAILQGKETP